MINFEEYNNQTTNEAFAVVGKENIYPAKLAVVRMSKQNPKFLEEGQTPKDQISFVFDVINENGESVHVATKPCTVSFTDKSNLPKIWANAFDLRSGKDLSDNLYKDGKLQALPVTVYVAVTRKDDKVFNEITKVVSLEKKSDQKATDIREYDLKVYGQPCEQYDLATGYTDLN